MGDRAQVRIKNDDDSYVYLYTHGRGSELQDIVRRALARKQRWDDNEYLTRIIFCEMVKGDEAEEIGFGIGTSEHDDNENPLITIDCGDQTVAIGNKKSVSFRTFIAEAATN